MNVSFSDKRYVLLDNELADMIEDVNHGDLKLLLRSLLMQSNYSQGALIRVTSPDGRCSFLAGKIRRKSRM